MERHRARRIAFTPEILSGLDSENDRNFLIRTYSTDPQVYFDRLRAIGFHGLGVVLDAGCGFGQWAFQMALLNDSVEACDVAEDRISVCKKIKDTYAGDFSNCHFQTGNLENMTYHDGSFDAVFAYSCLYRTDYRRTLREIYRVLKKGGKLYFSTNDLGWYIYNLIEDHNPSSDYSPKQMAIDTLQNSLNYYIGGSREVGKSILMPRENTLKELAEAGFRVIACGADASINATDCKVKSFYKEHILGMTNVYEVLCEKS